MFACSNREITVMSMLMMCMLWQRGRSSVGDKRMSLLMTGHTSTAAKSSCRRSKPQQSCADRNAPSLYVTEQPDLHMQLNVWQQTARSRTHNLFVASPVPELLCHKMGKKCVYIVYCYY